MSWRHAKSLKSILYSAEIVLSTRSDTAERLRPSRFGGIRRCLERPVEWKPGVRQGFPGPDGGKSGQGQTGMW